MISFLTDNIKMPKLDRKAVRTWITAVVDGYDNRKVGRLNYIFCNDDRILEVNRQFLGHDYYTDIITFDYSEPGVVSGDMYISLETVKTNSSKFGTSYDEELMRVMIHGVLHLCGIDDKGPGERAVMEAAENRALEMW
ncbi:MAG TPA: rRNA maturation RNase YbeY [Bacteroidaceae bacterium]|nr:rRNA maturation RNase YbeY [Bacteroidaceae bacterium]HQL26616.1 rRNA maturation RNase YbeY [Bacteroidaceae bacterium]